MKTKQIETLIAATQNNHAPIFVGNDVVCLSNFLFACTPQFIKKVFTSQELAYCQQFDKPLLRYASTWAAKEAVYKALKQADGDLKLWWKDIEITRENIAGKPTVSVHKPTKAAHISLSISHDADVVWAVAVVS